MKISAVIVTYNEEEKLAGCLESISKLADEVVIVDLGSKDKTLEIAKKINAKIFHHAHVPYVESVRNYSVSKAGGDWVLVLDPDERVQESLAVKLRGIANEGKDDVVNVPRKNMIFGKWLKHTNCWPDKHTRFFKKGKVSWTERIHLYPRIEGKLLDLPAKEEWAIIHHNYSSIKEFMERQNRYTDISAQNRYQAGERFNWFNFFWKPARLFIQRFIRHAGFLDGFQGLAFSYLTMIYQLVEEVKLWEKQHTKLS